MKENTCCIFGNRKITQTNELKESITLAIKKLITEEKIHTFLFGSKSQFDSFCLDIVSELKEKYQHIKRIYVRAEFPDIDEKYKNYLLSLYEDTYFPDKIRNAGKAAYVERNYEMIDNSKYCIVYYDEQNLPSNRKSGTKTALLYAEKQNKDIILFP